MRSDRQGRATAAKKVAFAGVANAVDRGVIRCRGFRVATKTAQQVRAHRVEHVILAEVEVIN
jgi:hypothetical protein